MSSPRVSRFALPLQVAAVCYRRVNSHAEFLLVHTNGGNKWTFPKGAPSLASRTARPPNAKPRKKPEPPASSSLTTSTSTPLQGRLLASRRRAGIVVKAFLMEVRQTRQPEEDDRNPTWFEADRARAVLAKGREVKYATNSRL